MASQLCRLPDPRVIKKNDVAIVTGAILALDLGIRVGWACGRPGDMPICGAVRLKLDNQARGVAGANFIAWLQAKITECRPQLIVKEAVLSLAGFQRKQAGEKTVQFQVGLHVIAESVAHAYRIPIKDIHPATVRKHFIGRGHAGGRAATKAAVVQRCRMLRLLPRDVWDDDRADALAVWVWAEANYSRACPRNLILFEEENEH